MQHDASSAVTAHIDAAYEAIMADGYVVLKTVITPDLVAQINDGFDPIFARTPFCVGGFYGEKTKRFGSLLRRSTGRAHRKPVSHRPGRTDSEPLVRQHPTQSRTGNRSSSRRLAAIPSSRSGYVAGSHGKDRVSRQHPVAFDPVPRRKRSDADLARVAWRKRPLGCADH